MFNSNASSAAGGVNYIEDVFSTWLYTGNGSTQTITNGIDLSTKSGLTWIRRRGSATDHHLEDTVRGATKYLISNTTGTEQTNVNAITAFNSTGFSLGSYADVNSNAGSFASWTFREQPKFFDVVTYTGNGTTQAIAHNLGSTPGFVIIKSTTLASDWRCFHRSAPTGYTYLNSADPLETISAANVYGNNSTVVAPTSTNITVGSSGAVNNSGDTFVAYVFAHDAGGFGLSGTDNVISCGSYTGNGSTSGPVVTLGYEPQWLLVKRSSAGANDWVLFDNMRGMPVGSVDSFLRPNTSQAEDSLTDYVSPTATGFNVVSASSNVNTNTNTYIYIAIRRGPMKVPTSGTSVFDADFGNNVTVANTSVFSSAITTDLLLYLNPAGAGPVLYDRLRGGDNVLQTDSTAAETTGGFANFDTQTGVNSDTVFNFTSRVGVVFRRAPGYFDEVCYTGNGSTQALTHNLTVIPELLILKRRSGGTGGWPALATNISKFGYLDGTFDFFNTATEPNYFGNNTSYVSPTSSVFTVGSSTDVNASGSTYAAYLFATCAGVSKVGSYTGTAAAQTINCGFTAGSRFIMIKRTDSTGDWYIWDSARGIIAGNDPYLLLNSNAAEVTGTDYVDTTSVGFDITSTAPAAINANGGTYIFLAIA